MFLLKKLKNLKQSSFLSYEKHQRHFRQHRHAGKLTDEIKSTIERVCYDLSQKYVNNYEELKRNTF